MRPGVVAQRQRRIEVGHGGVKRRGLALVAVVVGEAAADVAEPNDADGAIVDVGGGTTGIAVVRKGGPVADHGVGDLDSGIAADAGKEAWARASCSNCHGSMAQGGDGGDYPVGPSLRNITFGKETMVGIVSCGIPGTPPMPAWLKGAYTKVECYGMPLGSIPAGMTVPAILTADEIKALVDYVFATFVQAPRP